MTLKNGESAGPFVASANRARESPSWLGGQNQSSLRRWRDVASTFRWGGVAPLAPGAQPAAPGGQPGLQAAAVLQACRSSGTSSAADIETTAATLLAERPEEGGVFVAAGAGRAVGRMQGCGPR